MTHPRSPRFRWLLLGSFAALVVSVLAVACGSTGYSPDCPNLPRYDVHNATQSNAAQALMRAHPTCFTAEGHATSSAGGSSSGGSGAGGASGSGPADAGGG